MTKPIWPKVPAGFVRSVLTGHSALGLFLAALAYLICVSGTIAVPIAEMRRWETPVAREAGAVTGEALNKALAEAVARSGGAPKSVIFSLPGRNGPRTTVSVYGDAKEPTVWLAAPDGGLTPGREAAFSTFLFELHANLHLGRWGFVIVGLVGVGMLALAVSGVLAHPRVFRDAFTLRWGGSKRLHEADLHNRLSVWGLPFNVAISITGAYFGVAGLLVMLVSAVQPDAKAAAASATRLPPVAANPAPAALPDLGAVVAYIRDDKAAADEPLSLSVSRPGTQGQSVTAYGDVKRRMIYGELYQFAQGRPPQRMGFADGPFGAQLYGTVYPLHFGDFGGLPLKVLYMALGFGLSVVCSSGVSIWLARRRDQGRPAPRWERVWTATAFGTLIGFSASALGVVAFDAPPGPVFWAAGLLCYPVALLVKRDAMLSVALKTVLAGLLLALAVVHAVLHAGAMPGLSAAVDGVLLVFAAWLAWLCVRQRRRMAALAQ